MMYLELHLQRTIPEADLPFFQALQQFVVGNRKEGKMSFLEVHFDKMDIPSSLAAAGESMAQKNKIAK